MKRRRSLGTHVAWLASALALIIMGSAALWITRPRNPSPDLADGQGATDDGFVEQSGDEDSDPSESPADDARQNGSDNRLASDTPADELEEPIAVPPWRAGERERATDGSGSTNTNRRIAATPLPTTQLVTRIDSHFRQLWAARQLEEKLDVDDEAWVRRVWWALFGVQPTSEEAADAVRDLASSSPERWIDELMAVEHDPSWQGRWAGVLARTLLNRPLSPQPDANANANTNANTNTPTNEANAALELLARYCESSLRSEQGLDELARSLIVAQGSSDPDSEEFAPEVVFWLGAARDDTTLVADRVSRALLGIRLDCARCHDHPLGTWSQESYWQLNAYLAQVRVTREGGRTGPWNVTEAEVNRDGSTPRGVFFNRLDGTVAMVEPRWTIDPTQPTAAGAPSDGRSTRAVLADQVVSSRHFARAMANRVWSGVMGVGLVSDVDNWGPHNPSPHGELLELLADQVVAADYDLKPILKWVLLSAPLRAADATEPVRSDTVVWFDRYPHMPMQLPSTPDTLDLLADLSGGRMSLADVESRGLPWLGQEGVSGRQREANRPAEDEVELSRVLQWLRTQALRPDLAEADEALVRRLTVKSLDHDLLIDHAFLHLLRRLPTPSERQDARQLLAGTSPEFGLRQIWTALRAVAEAGDYR